MILQDHILPEIQKHAADDAPLEACGLLVVCSGRQRYMPCKNISATPSETFRINEIEFAEAEDYGEILAIVHSHVNIPPVPSQMDLVECERSRLPWIIVNHPTGQHHVIEPSGYKAPLVGRTFSQGVLDCYELAKDYYDQELRIELPHFERDYDWWLNGGNLITENFARAGFFEVPLKEIKPHDGLIMQIESPVPNHVAVYIGNNLIMHHVINRLSSRDPYGGYWRKMTVKAVRHERMR